MSRARSDVDVRPRAALEPTARSEQAADDDAFDTEMIRIMSEAADLRAERARIRSAEDDRLATREAAAILTLIRTRAGGGAGAADVDVRGGMQVQLEPE